MAARKLARELSRLVLEIVIEADGTCLVFDFVGMEELGFFEECFETDGHVVRIEEGWLDSNVPQGRGADDRFVRFVDTCCWLMDMFC